MINSIKPFEGKMSNFEKVNKPLFSSSLSFKGDTFTNNRYLLAFDLDGTFLQTDKKAMKDFLDLVKNKDHKLVFVTSRQPQELSEIKQEFAKEGIDLPLPDYFISNDGQFIYEVKHDNGKIEMIPDKQWESVVAKFDINLTKEAIHQYTKEISTGAQLPVKEIDYKTSNFNVWYLYDHKLKDSLPGQLEKLLKEKNIQGRIIEDYVEPCYMKKKRNFNDYKHMVDPESGCYAFAVSAVNKADAVKYIQDKLKIKPDNVVAAGNGGNDISLTNSGFMFIAVNNAKALLKEYISKLSTDLKKRVILATQEGLAGINEGLTKIFNTTNDAK